MKKITLGTFALLSSLFAAATFASELVVPPTTVPEPGTLGLMAMGVVGIVVAARAKRRK